MALRVPSRRPLRAVAFDANGVLYSRPGASALRSTQAVWRSLLKTVDVLPVAAQAALKSGRSRLSLKQAISGSPPDPLISSKTRELKRRAGVGAVSAEEYRQAVAYDVLSKTEVVDASIVERRDVDMNVYYDDSVGSRTGLLDLVGKSLAEWRDNALPSLAQELKSEEGRVILYPGTTEGLAMLAQHGMRRAIITNAVDSAEEKARWLEAAGLPSSLVVGAPQDPSGREGTWNSLISSAEVGFAKPAPEIYRACAADLGLSLEEVLFVGHSPQDLMGARAAGMPCVRFTPDVDPRPKEKLQKDAKAWSACDGAPFAAVSSLAHLRRWIEGR